MIQRFHFSVRNKLIDIPGILFSVSNNFICSCLSWLDPFWDLSLRFFLNWRVKALKHLLARREITGVLLSWGLVSHVLALLHSVLHAEISSLLCIIVGIWIVVKLRLLVVRENRLLKSLSAGTLHHLILLLDDSLETSQLFLVLCILRKGILKQLIFFWLEIPTFALLWLGQLVYVFKLVLHHLRFSVYFGGNAGAIFELHHFVHVSAAFVSSV